MLHDLRHAFRHFRRTPGFLLLAVLTIAIGIASNASIFAVVQGVLLRSLPYRGADRIVVVGEQSDIPGATNIGYQTLLDWRARTRSFEALAVYNEADYTLSGAGEAEYLAGVRGSADFFRVIGVDPSLGRTWSAAEDRPGAARVVVLGHALWQRRFGGDPAVVGRTITLNENPYQVIGILPADFRAYFAERDGRPADVFVPLGYDASLRDACRDCRHLRGLARIRQGVSGESAAADLRAAHEAMVREHPNAYPARRPVVLLPLAEKLTEKIRRPLVILTAAAGLVLVVACVNVANLLLMRGSGRSRELAVRAALGATRARLIRQGIAESVALTAAGGLAGAVLAAWLTPLLLRLAPAELGQLDRVRVDSSTLAWAMAASVAAGIAAGMLPAAWASRSATAGLRGGRSTETAEHRWGRRSLVAAELALTFGLLLAAGLLVKSFWRLSEVPPGFSAAGLVTMNLNSVSPRYPREEDDIRFFEQTLAAIRAQPGVIAAAATSVLPLSGNYDGASFRVAGRTYARESDVPSADRFVITPEYLAAMSIPVLRGRGFDTGDRAGAPAVALVSEAAVRRYFAGEDPLGKALEVGSRRAPRQATIVGVVGDVHQFGLDRSPAPQFYLPIAQTARGYMTLVVQGGPDTAATLAAARRGIAAVDATRAVSKVATLEELVARSLAQRRFLLLLLGGAAGIAMALAVVGVYSTAAFHVARRSREFGLRVALGAGARELTRLVAAELALSAVAGLAAGLALGLAAGRLLDGLLFEVRFADPGVIAAGAAALLLSVAGAGWAPWRRALRADPAVLLKDE